MFIATAIVAVLEPRLALLLFLLLLLAAAAPIVVGWLSLLPAEREPFAVPSADRVRKSHDAFAVFLLANISFSVILRAPGFHAARLSWHITKLLPPEWGGHLVMIGFIWFGFVPGLAAAYAAVRANPMRLPLLLGGALTLMLWLLGPWLLKFVGTTG
jgi:hypothetical protein